MNEEYYININNNNYKISSKLFISIYKNAHLANYKTIKKEPRNNSNVFSIVFDYVPKQDKNTILTSVEKSIMAEISEKVNDDAKLSSLYDAIRKNDSLNDIYCNANNFEAGNSVLETNVIGLLNLNSQIADNVSTISNNDVNELTTFYDKIKYLFNELEQTQYKGSDQLANALGYYMNTGLLDGMTRNLRPYLASISKEEVTKEMLIQAIKVVDLLGNDLNIIEVIPNDKDGNPPQGMEFLNVKRYVDMGEYKMAFDYIRSDQKIASIMANSYIKSRFCKYDRLQELDNNPVALKHIEEMNQMLNFSPRR